MAIIFTGILGEVNAQPGQVELGAVPAPVAGSAGAWALPRNCLIGSGVYRCLALGLLLNRPRLLSRERVETKGI